MAIIKNKKKKIKKVKITAAEARAIAAKTGYTEYGVQRIIRSKSRSKRHEQVMALYAKVLHLRSLHEENYKKDLEDI